MRILITDRFFWPDRAPHSGILKQIALWLSEDGHEVKVLSAQPAYAPEAQSGKAPWKEDMDGVNIRRVWLLPEKDRGSTRYINYLLFSIRAFWASLTTREVDIVLCQSTPPVIQPFAVALATKLSGRKFLYHVHDIHPELSRTSGLFQKNIIYNFLVALDNFSLQQATVIVPLSNDMERTLRKRTPMTALFKPINNFPPYTPKAKERPAGRSGSTGGPLRFIYAGNVGQVQGLDKLVEGFSKVPSKLATLEILGGGGARKKLKKLAKDIGYHSLVFTNALPPQATADYSCKFDYGIVTLRPDIIKYAFPSKTAAYLAAELKLFAIIEPDAELAKAINALEIGATVSPKAKAEEITAAVIRLAKAKRTSSPLSEEARMLFDKDSIKALWLKLFRDIDR